MLVISLHSVKSNFSSFLVHGLFWGFGAGFSTFGAGFVCKGAGFAYSGAVFTCSGAGFICFSFFLTRALF